MILVAYSSDTDWRKTSASSVRKVGFVPHIDNIDILQDIFVPPDQVIDTVDVYHLQARHRKLSLRFLTWAVLNQHIQTDTHDSIEDARSALLLYKTFQEYEEQGIFDEKLEELYHIGKQYVGSFILSCYGIFSSGIPTELETTGLARFCAAIASFTTATATANSTHTLTIPRQ